MKYEKRKRTRTVDAVQLNSLTDIDKILKECKHVRRLAEARWDMKDPEDCWAIVVLSEMSEPIPLNSGEYFVWDDKHVWTMEQEAFEDRYESVPISYSIPSIYTTSSSLKY
jgi:hypothetical protein